MSDKEKKKSRKKLWQWIISIIFIVGSLGILSDSFFAGVFSLVAGVIICPPITKLIKEKSEGKAKTWMFVTAFIVLVLFSGMALPNSETSQHNNIVENSNPIENQVSNQETTTQEQVQQECIPNWKCGEWTICSNEVQTRTCTDRNDCGTNNGKPVETQNCKDYDLEMSISELLDEFSGLTKLQQEEKIEELKGKRIKTSTLAYKIDKASLSTQYVVMDDDYLYPSVKAFFPAEEKDKLLKVNIGDEITFIGEFVTYKKGTYVPSYVEFTKSKLVG